ncbi:Non-histone chromosomal protein 6 [Coemansia sp. RSA 1813]|nr:Non-histone chromosomal protein 6 [Coemansia sp. RSA 1646]KAJ1771387.1 Non-histone chromosomal protein 6 [Coemansia sp. RSA 1843]KAJ2093160.1 Non-histone chromosomal protein 6 [Coemansia sp. RSA 986]KAJ2217574.1 Non-histone chromosomal protein 6 [Coemansia sp. RSA 487]KAJ2573414.1 Non-histone chromosomal protein 6 [Coemansia sp. RSA 1813]
MPRVAGSRKKAADVADVAPVKATRKGKTSGRVEKATKPAKRGKRGKKNPDAPKRALSAYMFFSQANRATVRENNPDVSFGTIGKLLGEQWKGMTDAEKTPYTKKADEDKARYEADKAKWDEENSS